MERQLLRRFMALTSKERAKVIKNLTDLAASDEAWAEIRIGLTSVTLDLCFIDQSPCRMLSYSPPDLLTVFNIAADGPTETVIRLVID